MLHRRCTEIFVLGKNEIRKNTIKSKKKKKKPETEKKTTKIILHLLIYLFIYLYFETDAGYDPYDRCTALRFVMNYFRGLGLAEFYVYDPKTKSKLAPETMLSK
jgi:hypothetical protein